MRTYTIWLFIGPSSGERVIAARASHASDKNYQHEYQRIMGHIAGFSEASSLALWMTSK